MSDAHQGGGETRSACGRRQAIPDGQRATPRAVAQARFPTRRGVAVLEEAGELTSSFEPSEAAAHYLLVSNAFLADAASRSSTASRPFIPIVIPSALACGVASTIFASNKSSGSTNGFAG